MDKDGLNLADHKQPDETNLTGRRSLSKLCNIGLIAGVGLGLAASHASANIISEFSTVFNTDWTTAGVGAMRGSGVGTLPVTGVGSPVTQSYLYWAGPTNSSDPN